MKYELPLVNQEQGVVYLFAKYWDKIPKLNNLIKEIEVIRVGFPDVIYLIKDSTDFNGIEFEFNLSAFKKDHNRADIRRFYDDYQPKGKFIIIYWNEDIPKKSIEDIFKNIDIDLEFINLSIYFIPCIMKIRGINVPYLVFHSVKPQKIKFKNIFYDFNNLKSKKFVELRSKEKKNIRVIGYDPKKANDIMLNHWKLVNFFTTTSNLWNGNEKFDKVFHLIILRDKEDNLLLLKPYYLFWFTRKNLKSIRNFFDKYYFVGKLSYWEDFTEPYCVIYKDCKYVPSEKGRIFIDYLVKTKAKIGKRKKFNQGGYRIYPTEKKYVSLIKMIKKLNNS